MITSLSMSNLNYYYYYYYIVCMYVRIYVFRPSPAQHQGVYSYIKDRITFYRLQYAVVKVQCTLVKALRLCTGRTAHRESTGIALPFLDHGTRRGEGSASRPSRSLLPGKARTHCTGDWVGPWACLDRRGKSRSNRDLIPGTSSP
jgi:hypothetical protein